MSWYLARKVAIVGILLLGLAVPVPFASAQQQQDVVVIYTPDPETDAELEILEAEIAQLRRKLRRSRMKDIQKTKEWREMYNDTAQRIKKWHEFSDKYGVGSK